MTETAGAGFGSILYKLMIRLDLHVVISLGSTALFAISRRRPESRFVDDRGAGRIA
jgi:hypothetical protein